MSATLQITLWSVWALGWLVIVIVCRALDIKQERRNKSEGRDNAYFERRVSTSVMVGWGWPLYVIFSPLFAAIVLLIWLIEKLSQKAADL